MMTNNTVSAVYNTMLEDFRKSKKADEKFVYAKVCQMLAEKVYSECTSAEWRDEVYGCAKAIVIYGCKLTPERYAQLNKIALEVFHTLELTIGNGVD